MIDRLKPGLVTFIIIIIETFVTRLLQLKNEHKRYICYIKIYKNTTSGQETECVYS